MTSRAGVIKQITDLTDAPSWQGMQPLEGRTWGPIKTKKLQEPYEYFLYPDGTIWIYHSQRGYDMMSQGAIYLLVVSAISRGLKPRLVRPSVDRPHWEVPLRYLRPFLEANALTLPGIPTGSPH